MWSREAGGGGESGKSLEHRRREPERDQAGGKQEYGRGIDQGRDRDCELDGGRRGSGSVANISGRSGSFNTACEASATGMTSHGSPQYGGEGGKLRKGQDELAAARAALAEAAKAAAARVAGATDENRRWERFVALLE